MASSYKGDPRRMTARFDSECACNSDPPHMIAKGASIFYYPKGKKAYVGHCADRNEADFLSAVADEDAYNGF